MGGGADSITYGTHEVGDFAVSVAPAAGHEAADPDDCDFFEVLVHEVKFRGSEVPGAMPFYVNIAADGRFDWFGHFGKFERRLTHDDLVEYNACYSALFHKIAMPTWKLSRHSMKRLFDLCRKASKKAKK